MSNSLKLTPMRNPSGRAPWVGSVLLGMVAVGLASSAISLAQNVPFPPSKWNRVLIVSGGPSADYNQYAIESNARYVASLTNNAKWRHILFADGKPTSKTISTIADTPRTRARAIASWIWDLNAPEDVTEFKAPTLKPIIGPATPDSISQHLAAFTAGKGVGEPELVYFTGHGSPGSGLGGREDYINTVYSAWGDDYSMRQLARSLQASTSSAPLVLVMVQCHSGGFANVMFQDGDPTKPIWNHDFCGFFASIPERMASGCTSQVNERDYQDFTTHFFAALSGVARDGRRITGADYDRNGRVSLDEAYSYAQINDDSIDVPLSTSDAYLRSIFVRESNSDWQKISFSSLNKDASPQQAAVLNQLSTKLGLTGESRLIAAQKLYSNLSKDSAKKDSGDWAIPKGINAAQFNTSYDRLEKLLNVRYPNAARLRGVARNRALDDATNLIAAHPADLGIVYRAYSLSMSDDDSNDVKEARLLRFLRVGRSIILTKRLQRTGTPDQKAIFARLRTSETRSVF